jgi:hypothetical protein
MSIYKIPTGLVPEAPAAENYVAGRGVVFFDSTGILRLGDGRTPGGRILTAGSVNTSSYAVTSSLVNGTWTFAVSTTGSVTLNGVPFVSGGSGNYTLYPATTTTLGGIIIGNNLAITTSGVLSAVIGNIDGGVPNSVYGGLPAIDGGGI